MNTACSFDWPGNKTEYVLFIAACFEGGTLRSLKFFQTSKTSSLVIELTWITRNILVKVTWEDYLTKQKSSVERRVRLNF